MNSHIAHSRRETLHHSLAWMGLCFALATNVVDEAAGRFLSVYDPAARELDEHLSFLNPPAFTFETWLTGIVMVTIVLFSLSFFAFLGMRWMLSLSFPFAILSFVNGIGHITSAICRCHAIPGAYSSPLLVAGTLYLLLRTHKLEKHH